MSPDQIAAIRSRYDRLDAYLEKWDGADYKLEPDQVATVIDDIPTLLDAVERLTVHSTWLNTISFAIAAALGEVPPGADAVMGNPIEQAARLIAERDRALKVIRLAYEAGDDAWRICADALHPTIPGALKLATAEPSGTEVSQ